MGQCLGGGLLSLVAHTLWHAFALNLKGFFTHFIVVFSHLFAYKRHFLGYFAFFKFLNALFFGLLCPFCHFERSALAQSEKSTEFKTHFKFKVKNPRFKGAISTLNLWILRFLAKAQYDKGFVIMIFAKAKRGNPKVNLRLNLWITTQIFAKFARNDSVFCHFERSALAQSEKSILSY